MSEYPEPEYKTIVEKSPDLIFITNESGVLYINPSGVEYLGYRKKEEILGRPALDFIHPDSHEVTTKYAQQRRVGGNPPSQYRAKLLGKDGKALDAELHASRILWNNEPASLTIARDISEQVQLEEELQESNERLAGFMESATDGFALLDEKLRLIEANKVWLNQAGLTREKAIGRHCTDILPNLKKTGRLDIYKNVLETSEPTEFNEVIPASGGDQYFDIKAFKTGNLLGIVTRDITDQVTYDKKLQELHLLSNRLSQAQSIQEIAEIVVEAVVDTLDCKRVSFQTIRENKLVIQAAKPSITIRQIPLDKPSIVVRAFKTGQPQHIPDTTKDSDYLEGIGKNESPSLSEYAHPIKLREEPIAVINIEEPQKNAFTEQTIELVSILGDHVSSALQAQSYRDRLIALHSSSTRLTHVESSEEIYTIATDILVEELGYTWAGIMSVEDYELRYVYTSDDTLTGESLPRDGAGITVKAANSKSTQLVRDTRLDPDFVTIDCGPPQMLSELAVPVFIEDKVRYVLNVESRRVDDFDENDIKLVELLAQHIASTIQNIKGLESRKRYEVLLETLHQYASQVARMDSIQEIADTSIDFIVDIMGFNRAGIGLIKGEYIHPISLADPQLKAKPISLKKPSIMTRAVNTGESQLIKDTRKDKDYLLYNEAGPDYSYSELTVPIKDGKTVIGVINIESTERTAYDQRDQILMELFAEHISSALRNIKASKDQQIYEKRLESLSMAMASMNSAQSQDELAELSLILVEEIIKAPYSGFIRVEGEKLVLFKNISDLTIDHRLPLDGKG
ncbi:MAG: GAF domain-containing protein, partial [archaeon]